MDGLLPLYIGVDGIKEGDGERDLAMGQFEFVRVQALVEKTSAVIQNGPHHLSAEGSGEIVTLLLGCLVLHDLVQIPYLAEVVACLPEKDRK
jgi:hypothetical protein